LDGGPILSARTFGSSASSAESSDVGPARRQLLFGLEGDGGGAFINVLSVFSWVAAPLITTYSASKAAAWSFTNAARIELRRQGTQVVGVHAGPVDTDMAAAFDLEKIPAAIVAASALDALEANEPEAVVDDYSRAVKAGLSDDQGALYPQIERQFLAMTGAGTTAN